MSPRIRGGAGLAALAVFAFALTGSAAAATSTASSAVRGVTATAETGSSTAVAQYWTAERMRSAVPVEPERGRPSVGSRVAVPERGAPGQVNAAAPSELQQTALRISSRLGATAQDWAAWYRPPGSTSGKVFFTGDDGVNRVCSGSTVNSGGKNVVFTAGHCVHGGGAGRRYFTNWAFVPGYRDGARPYGTWSARQLWSLNGWTNSGWVVRKGQKIRITGTGEVSIGRGKSTGPSGLYDLEDNAKLLKSVPTGALIAVIGDDNNEFIYVGTEREFTATRDGALFLGLNEGNLNDNTGSFDVRVEISPDGEE